eukprot:1161411-Pelagomonas_calceolata.AAC.6
METGRLLLPVGLGGMHKGQMEWNGVVWWDALVHGGGAAAAACRVWWGAKGLNNFTEHMGQMVSEIAPFSVSRMDRDAWMEWYVGMVCWYALMHRGGVAAPTCGDGKSATGLHDLKTRFPGENSMEGVSTRSGGERAAIQT